MGLQTWKSQKLMCETGDLKPVKHTVFEAILQQLSEHNWQAFLVQQASKLELRQPQLKNILEPQEMNATFVKIN